MVGATLVLIVRRIIDSFTITTNAIPLTIPLKEVHAPRSELDSAAKEFRIGANRRPL